jgi:hypothetical protein
LDITQRRQKAQAQVRRQVGTSFRRVDLGRLGGHEAVFINVDFDLECACGAIAESESELSRQPCRMATGSSPA